MSLLIVGTVAFDGIETPFGKKPKILGGSATYICLAASYFCPQSNLISVVGGDFLEKDILLLKEHGANCDGLEIIKSEKTFFWSGKYHNDMNQRDTIETQLNVLEKFDPKIPEKYQDCEYLMLANLMPSLQLKVIKDLKRQPKLIVTDTMNFWMDNCLSDLMLVINKTDVLIINEEEALQLAKTNSLKDSSEIIKKMGPDYVIIKRGEYGAILYGDDQEFFCPSFRVKKCIDPTGAGDTFAGAFIGHIANTKSVSFENMEKAVVKACAMASFCVEDFGIQNIGHKNNSEIQHRIDLLHKQIV
tara:strand:+ start:117 stop:1022 length:906 start_codon:yes stop_codon:yes gene_type:complete